MAGRGGMGVVFQATQLALSRPVALKVIAPDLAADDGYRERFERESRLTASIDHPNVIPVYGAGEFDGRLYLIMRWVEGTDLSSLLSSDGRLSPGRAVRFLRPVASALGAAHRRGLVHRDIKPANVLIARSDGQEDHVYLTDFGIARRTDAEPMTRTGMIVGTVDYMAPERFEGGKGDAASDIYSFGCMLFEVLTGHVPFDRAENVAKIFAHVSDPIPSAGDTVDGVPQQLDAIIAKAMAKRPEDRFESAEALVAALDQAVSKLDTAERAVASAEGEPEVAPVQTPSTETEPITSGATEYVASASEPTVRDARSPQATTATRPLPPPPRPDEPQRPKRAPYRSPALWVATIVLLALVGVLIAVLSKGSSHNGGTAAAAIAINGSGLSEGRTVALPGAPGSISIGSENVWISLPGLGQLVRFNPLNGRRQSFPAAGGPTALAAGSKALWVAEADSRALAQFNGDSGERVAVTGVPGTPTAVAVDQNDSSGWVADSSGAISHVALGGGVSGTPAHISPSPNSLAWGAGWVWATNRANSGLVRVSLGTTGSSRTFSTGPHPIAVAVNQGVWVAHSDGQVTRFDPRLNRLRVNADLTLPAQLDSIATTGKSQFVWAISKSARTLYRITNTSKPTVTGTVRFPSAPVALAAAAGSVWVATEDDKVIEIRF
ncbi:MAG TPA: serine/threonine-protein kinase [Solirubrobacteraceae bacterium]|nr:serine/threonine-protein kinase [Solirubrobacteraceae bacterium]